MNWGCKEPWRGHGNSKGDWALHTVSTTPLEGKTFSKLSDLVEKLCLDLPEGAKQHVHGAFICLHRIPATAIVDERSGKEVELEVELGKYPDLDTGRWLSDKRQIDRVNESPREIRWTILEITAMMTATVRCCKRTITPSLKIV